MDYKKISKLFAELSEEFSKLVDTKTESAKEVMAAPVEPEDSDDEFSREDLEKMAFNELKKFAKDHGIDAKGKRDDIIERILAEVESEDVEDAEEPAEEKPAKKSTKKDKVVSFDEKADDVKKLLEQADEILDEYDEDDIISELKEVGIKGVTKKTLRDKIVEALKKGLLEFEDEEEDTEDEELPFGDAESEEDDADDDSDDDEEGEEIDENTYFEDYDDDNESNNPENVSSKKRMKAMVKLQKSLLNDIENEELDVDSMKSFILENSTEDEQEEVEDFDDDDIIATYLELRKRMIDDEGDDMSGEDDPYEVNGEVFAHGHLCPKTEDGKYVDEVSGDTFELAD